MKPKIIYRRALPFDDLKDRKELLRIVKTNDDLIYIDNDYKYKGRSVYLLKDITVLNIIKKKKLIERNLRYKGKMDDIYEQIENILK